MLISVDIKQTINSIIKKQNQWVLAPLPKYESATTWRGNVDAYSLYRDLRIDCNVVRTDQERV